MSEIIEVPYLQIAPIESEAIQFVSFVRHIEDGNGTPTHLMLQIAINREKSRSSSCDFPVYLAAKSTIGTAEHIKLLHQFSNGQPFAAVEIEGLHIYRRREDADSYGYYGTATGFRVLDMNDATRRLEDVI